MRFVYCLSFLVALALVAGCCPCRPCGASSEVICQPQCLLPECPTMGVPPARYSEEMSPWYSKNGQPFLVPRSQVSDYIAPLAP